MQFLELSRGDLVIRVRSPREWLKTPEKEAYAKKLFQDQYVDGFTQQFQQQGLQPKRSPVTTQIGGAVKLGEYLYGTTGQGLLCAEFLTGNVKWQERGVGAGSLCFADGSLFVHGENGDVALVEASPDSYREKGRFTPPDAPIRGNSKAWAYPVVANGRLYVRDLASLWCYDIKK